MIAELEDGMLRRLRDAFGIGEGNGGGALGASALPYKVLEVSSYGGQIDIGDDGRPQAQQGFRMPAVFVAFTGQKQEKREGERAAVQKLSWVVYCATYNARNERATRQGDPNEVGSYQLAEDVAQLLTNQHFGIKGARPLVLEQIEVVFTAARNDGAKAISVMAVHLHATYVMAASLSDCSLLSGAVPGEYLHAELRSIADQFYLRPAQTRQPGATPDAIGVVRIGPED